MKYSRDVNFLGRNGMFIQAGVLVSSNYDKDKIMIEPVTSKGGPGRCFIETPVEDIDAFIETLLCALDSAERKVWFVICWRHGARVYDGVAVLTTCKSPTDAEVRDKIEQVVSRKVESMAVMPVISTEGGYVTTGVARGTSAKEYEIMVMPYL